MLNVKGCRRIYIRHADKEYANGDSDIYKHDPGITQSGLEKTKMVAQHLIEQWGRPELIICSPYRRTRETAAIMSSVLDADGTGIEVPIHYDSDVAEYLGNHRSVPIDVTESTLVHDPPHPESFAALKQRVQKHNDKIRKYCLSSIEKNNEGVIWIITHGLIIKQIACLIGMKRVAKEFPTLTCLSIVDGEKMTKSEILMFNDTNYHDDCNSDSDSPEYTSEYTPSEDRQRLYTLRGSPDRQYVRDQ